MAETTTGAATPSKADPDGGPSRMARSVDPWPVDWHRAPDLPASRAGTAEIIDPRPALPPLTRPGKIARSFSVRVFGAIGSWSGLHQAIGKPVEADSQLGRDVIEASAQNQPTMTRAVNPYGCQAERI